MQVHFVKRAYGMMDLSRKCMATWQHLHFEKGVVRTYRSLN